MNNLKVAVNAGQDISQRIMQDRFLLRVTKIKKDSEKSNIIPFPIKTLPSNLVNRYSRRSNYGGDMLKRLFGFTKGRDQVVLVINKEDARI